MVTERGGHKPPASKYRWHTAENLPPVLSRIEVKPLRKLREWGSADLPSIVAYVIIRHEDNRGNP